MKTMYMRTMMMAMMAAACMTISAQRTSGTGGRGSVMDNGRYRTEQTAGRHNNNDKGYTEMRGNRKSGVSDWGARDGGGRHDQTNANVRHDDKKGGHNNLNNNHKGRVVVAHHAQPHHIPARWAKHVRHTSDGRWGYCRDGYWYYYDRYFDPDYYFAHSAAHFHSCCLGTVAVAAATTAAVAGLISALMH